MGIFSFPQYIQVTKLVCGLLSELCIFSVFVKVERLETSYVTILVTPFLPINISIKLFLLKDSKYTSTLL